MKQKKKRIRVAVAMSGGVDSSVTAWLLKKTGYDLIGIFMRLGNNQETSEAAARRVCHQLGIKFYPLNLARQFKREIVDYFLTSYKKGLTPNPCVKCNQTIKFGELLKIVKQLGADYLATGHYARLWREFPIFNFQFSKNTNTKINCKLYQARDKSKDQSYFLYNLTPEQLRQILFPLGGYTKEQVRKIARQAKLPYLTKESQDICFLAGDHNDFLKKKLKLKKGKIIALPPDPHPNPLPFVASWEREKFSKKIPLSCEERSGGGARGGGEVIGQHQGLPLYTIGQRRGVEIGGTGPYYVARTNYKTNTLYVVKDGDNPVLYSDKLITSDINWISGQKPKFPLICQAVIRYRHQAVKCTVIQPPLNLPLSKGEKKSGGVRYLVRFFEPQRAITPGQSAVFYQGNEVLGGGIIIK